MNNKVEESKKIRRLNILQEFQKTISLQKNKQLEGKEMEVLTEGLSKKGDQFSGRTGSNKVVNYASIINLYGKLVKVVIDKSYLNSLQGIYR